jgi:hypothetical protein
MDNLIGISGLTRCYPFELQFRHCKKEYGDYAQYYPKYHLNKRYYNNNDNYCDFYLHVNTLCEEGNFEKIEKLKNQFLEKRENKRASFLPNNRDGLFKQWFEIVE